MKNFSLFILQDGGGGGLAPFLFQMLPFILIFFVFYFLIIVPQKRRRQELENTISNLKAGDRIITTGGIIATVTAVRDTSLLVRSADKSMLEIARSAVASMQKEEEKK